EAERQAVERIASESALPAASPARAFVRSALDLDPLARQNASGMKVEKTLGPFVDRLGIEHFVDLIPVPHKFSIESAGGTLGLLVLDKVLVPSAPPRPIKLGAGSLWVAVRALIGGAAAGFVGIEFSDGTAEAVNVSSGPGGSLVLKAGSKLTLHL